MDQGEKAFYLLRPELPEEELRLLCLVTFERLPLFDFTAEPDRFEELPDWVVFTADRVLDALLPEVDWTAFFWVLVLVLTEERAGVLLFVRVEDLRETVELVPTELFVAGFEGGVETVLRVPFVWFPEGWVTFRGVATVVDLPEVSVALFSVGFVTLLSVGELLSRVVEACLPETDSAACRLLLLAVEEDTACLPVWELTLALLL